MFFTTQPDEVRPGLWLGGLGSLLHGNKYAHILSVIADSPYEPPETTKSHLTIPVNDVESAVLIRHFPAGTEFIKAGLEEGGKVLVHCAAGVSRSATMVIAYIMATEGLTLEGAIRSVREKRKVICPNAGFYEQLQLWEEMGCKLDESHPKFRYYKTQQTGYAWKENGAVDSNALAELKEDSQKEETVYRCKKCRRLVATESNTIPVPERGSGQNHVMRWEYSRPKETGGRSWGGGNIDFRDAFAVHAARVETRDDPGEVGTSLFVEPLRWMQPELDNGEIQGKLYCPGCTARLGSYNWSGIQSNSGVWMNPAFQLHLSRLDLVNHEETPILSVRKPKI